MLLLSFFQPSKSPKASLEKTSDSGFATKTLLLPLLSGSSVAMFPFFPPGSNPIPPNGGGGGASDPKAPPPIPPLGSSFPPFPMNQAPQFNMANAANMAMAMAMLNQNPQATLQLGLNALAAMQFINQGANMQPNIGGFQMQQNLNMLASIQSANSMMQQGLNPMAAANNPMLQRIAASGVGVSQGNQGVITQPGFSGAALHGANIQNNVSQSTSSATNATPVNVAEKSFKSNQHSIQQTRYRDNNSRQNVGQFSGSRGRGRGAPSNQTRARGQSDWREVLPEGKSPKSPENNSKKRRPTITYDENEIKLWREARRRNFPTTSNVEKKLVAKRNRSESENDDTELRRQQMKEVLAKQQELGFEAAEVPNHYLVNSKNHDHNYNNSRDRTQNRFNNKRGRHEGRGRFHDRRNLSSHPDNINIRHHPDNIKNAHHVKPREPTLLKKLLSAEIKADKCRILQAFRFMTENSFFSKWPDKELVFPHVMVKEAELEGKNGLDERRVESESSERESEMREERESGSAISMRKMEENNEEADKPEEGEITD